MVFSNAKSGISAKLLERHLAVTYKCSWRMLCLIRKTLRQFGERLKGSVETDGAYFGGRKKAGKDNKYLSQAFQAKTAVLGAGEIVFQFIGLGRAGIRPDNYRTCTIIKHVSTTP